MTGDPIEAVAIVLSKLPRDPADVATDDLDLLVPINAALAQEAERVRASMAALARRVDDDSLSLPDLLTAARQKAELEAQHGRVLIASKRLTDFTATAFEACGFNLAALMDGDNPKE